MKFSLMALPILLGITATGFSQTTTCKWGVSRYVVTNPEDSTVLVDAEKKMWKIEREQNAFRIYEGFFGGGGYNVGVSKQAMEWRMDSHVITWRMGWDGMGWYVT